MYVDGMTQLHDEYIDNFVNDIHHAHLRRSILGTIFGQAVGDALGAPFEFGPAGQYSSTFPHPVLTGQTEMIGGGPFRWQPGEFTDDTQMALVGILAMSDVHRTDTSNGGDPLSDNVFETMFKYFQKWSHLAADVGSTTRGSLSGSDWRSAAKNQHERSGFSASNGCVMRLGPMIAYLYSNFDDVYPSRADYELYADFAKLQAQLTHWDDEAVVTSMIMAQILVAIYDSVSENGFVDGKIFHDIIDIIDESRHSYASESLRTIYEWEPGYPAPTNGKAVTCLAQALWAVKTSSSFEETIIKTIDLGGDTDTVAAVAGAIAGAIYGVDSIPSRWMTKLNGEIPGTAYGHLDHDDLMIFVEDHVFDSDGSKLTSFDAPAGPKRLIKDVELYAANLPGIATTADKSFNLISLCRTAGITREFRDRRNFFIVDVPNVNPNLRKTVEDALDTIDAWLLDGRKVVVHCHAGRSRTGFILKAWYMRTYGASHDEAHKWLSSCWPIYDQFGNYDFTEFLDDFSDRT